MFLTGYAGWSPKIIFINNELADLESPGYLVRFDFTTDSAAHTSSVSLIPCALLIQFEEAFEDFIVS